MTDPMTPQTKPLTAEPHPWTDEQGRRWSLETGDICAICGSTPDDHIPDREWDEREALRTGTHVPAVDDFGNEYLDRVTLDAARSSDSGLREALERLIETAGPFSAIDVLGNALPVADAAYHELDDALEGAIAALAATPGDSE